jgi:hypothetical protein
MEEQVLKIATALGGFAGLAWCVEKFYNGRILKENTAAVDRNTHMCLLSIAASSHLSDAAKNEVSSQLKAVETAQVHRKK